MIPTAAASLLAVDEDQVTPGLLGFLIVVALAVALYFLLRSMAKHLRRIDVGDPDSEPVEPEPPRGSPEEPA